jgi:hypothetical protein
MEYPKRPPEHVTETTSWKILRDRTPSHWLVREVSERDYGIDAYIELVGTDGSLRGDLVSVQLKGTEDFEWNQSKDLDEPRRATFSGINKATINYWMNMPIPAFLVVTDNKDGKAYFAAIKDQVRSRYNEFESQQSFGFELRENYELGSKCGQILFLFGYIREKKFPELESALLNLLSNWSSYLRFIDENDHWDTHLEVETEKEVFVLQLCKLIEFTKDYFGLKFDIPDLNVIYEEDRKAFVDSFSSLHQISLQKILEPTRHALIETLVHLKNYVTTEKGNYWMSKSPAIWSMCQSLEIEQWRDQKYEEY